MVFETTKADQPVFWVDPDPPDGLTGFTWFTTEGEVRHASFDPVGPLFRLEDGGPLRAGTVVLYRPDTRDVVVLAEQWDVRLADAEHTPGLERYVVSLLEERALSESE
ncbi:MAG: hypothetical protein J7M08_06940 [Planctomycetes bacterium]|nr:hypothetical protein [Planctomycetota bacterium]